MIIFVAGIHGVGKTYLCAPAAKNNGFRHATASQLILEERKLQSWGEDKRVAGVDENQAALISATNRLRSSGEKLLLDGHFVLRGQTGEFNEIKSTVFRDLQISAVLLLQTNVDVIAGRLRERGDTSWTESELQIFAEREAAHAIRVSAELGISCTNLHQPSQQVFEKTICTILASI
jgi:adenylate kinase